MKLFCFPYAGGLSSIYNDWRQLTEPDIELIPVELAGRGMRASMPLYENIQEAVADLYLCIRPHLESGAPFALFGHSLGAILACEMAYYLQGIGLTPASLFLSGRLPLHTVSSAAYHLLPDDKLMDYVLSLGGVRKELHDKKEIWEIFLPIIRADFKIVEKYSRSKEDMEPLACPITVFYGIQDRLTSLDKLQEWSDYTSDSCDYYNFEGGHFFIHERKRDVIEVIQRKLNSHTPMSNFIMVGI